MRKILFTSIVLSSFYMTSAEAYMYSYTNTLDQPVYVTFCGIAKIGCTMFTGKDKADQQKHTKIDDFGSLIEIHNAGKLYGPQKIEPLQTVNFHFRDAYCLNLNSIKISIAGGMYVPPKLERVTDEYFSRLQETIAQTGHKISEAGDTVSNTNIDPRVQAGAKIVAAAGDILGPITSLFGLSTCKDASFAIVKEPNQPLAIRTSDFNG